MNNNYVSVAIIMRPGKSLISTKFRFLEFYLKKTILIHSICFTWPKIIPPRNPRFFVTPDFFVRFTSILITTVIFSQPSKSTLKQELHNSFILRLHHFNMDKNDRISMFSPYSYVTLGSTDTHCSAQYWLPVTWLFSHWNDPM